MNSFCKGFLISFLICFFILLILRLTIPYASKLFGNQPIPYQSDVESTAWLNFIIDRFIFHFQSKETLNAINNVVNEKIHPMRFQLVSFGNTPSIGNVETLEMKQADDIKILIPMHWKKGPSFDMKVNGCTEIMVDLLNFNGKVLIEWLGNSESDVRVRFIENVILDFDLSIRLFDLFEFSLTRVPLLDPIIKGLISVFISKQVVNIPLPKPNIETRNINVQEHH